MKGIIVFYSYSDNTRKTAVILADFLKEQGDIQLCELKPLDESGSFFRQAARAFSRARSVLPEMDFNLGSYDMICLGTPVWAFGPAPAINTYLDRCSGLEGKTVVLFTTYGSGTGNGRCLDYMQNVLIGKGVKTFKRFSIQQSKVRDREYALSTIKKALGSD
ncbi:MAG: flavodoxin [Candidatus Omnitrophica bacterium]|nr:flavodoxin [Candidatus Omnitrophota bacterium]